MPKLTLSFASAYNERVEPLMDGTVEVEGLEFIPTHSGPSETFYRQLKFFEFDVSEMSLSSYIIARARGVDMVAIPVFPSRRLFHTEVAYNADSGVKAPGDLVGKRIGVAEYQQTAALWTRGVLEHDFDVSQYKVHWYMERTEELSHGGATGFQPPPGISFQRIPTDKSLASMLLAGELDAAAVVGPWTRAQSFVDRSNRIPGSGDWSRIKLLFPDKIAETRRFFHAHGFLPANHTYIVRGSVYRQNPWVAINLFNGFVKAKALAAEKLIDRIPSGLFFGREYAAMTREVVGDDPFAYGIKANRQMLTTLIDYSHEQGLIKDKPKIEELFAESTRDL